LAGRTLAGAASFLLPHRWGVAGRGGSPPERGEKYLVLFPNNVKFGVAI